MRRSSGSNYRMSNSSSKNILKAINIFLLNKINLHLKACVTKCPTDSFIHSVQACNAEGVEEYKKRLICDLHVDKNAELTNCNDIDKFMEADRCAKWYIKSDPCKYLMFKKNIS